MINNRLFGLDYLRGFAAFIILIYHYISWGISKVEVSTFLGKFGIYGVSIFYVLSGLTLYHVYFKKMNPLSIKELKFFYLKRFFRIFPLLWLVTILTIIGKYKEFSFKSILLNLSGLFGYFDWDNYIAIGSWSIGNELVFYSFFPLFLLVFKQSSSLIKIGFSITILFVFILFANFILNENISLANQWRNYVNPLNQLLLFFSGFMIGYIFNGMNFNSVVSIILFLIGTSIFLFLPTSNRAIDIVTGFERYMFSISCILICLSMYKLKIENTKSWLHKLLFFFGEISYSIYLIHPIVYSFVGLVIVYLDIDIPGLLYYKFLISLTLSILFSHLVYEYYEKYFVKIGNNILYGKKMM